MKIVARTELTPEFIPGFLQVYTSWMTIMSALANTASQRTMDKHAVTIGRLLPIVKGQSPGLRSGLDYEITRFRALKYVKFEVFQHGNNPYLAGTTQHITCREWNGKKEIKGELGQYFVALPFDIFTRPDLGHIHMIPLRNGNSRTRHPHHYTRNYSQREIPEPAHPLDRETGNCYGDYSGPLKGLLDDPDLPALFQQLQGHLSTYGISPPKHLDQLDFDHTTPEAR
jgi:hypothetical protein